MNTRLHFLCVNYNDAHHTERWLRSLAAQRGVEPERLLSTVVDNSTSAAERERLSSACAGRATLVRSPGNVGYFRGLNLALESLARSAEDYVVIGNNDLEFAPDFASKLMGRHYDDDVLVVAPDVVTADGYHQNPHVTERMSSRRKLLLAIYFHSYACARLLTFASRSLRRLRGGRRNHLAGTSRFIYMGIGACYVLTPAFFRHFSRLNDEVFLYGEEALLAGQVASVGGKTFYDAELHVLHAESATLSRVPSRVAYEYGQQSFPLYRKFL